MNKLFRLFLFLLITIPSSAQGIGQFNSILYNGGTMVTEASGMGPPKSACSNLARYTQLDSSPPGAIWNCVYGTMHTSTFSMQLLQDMFANSPYNITGTICANGLLIGNNKDGEFVCAPHAQLTSAGLQLLNHQNTILIGSNGEIYSQTPDLSKFWDISTTAALFSGTVTATAGFNASNSQVFNLAPGTKPTDAVTFGQLPIAITSGTHQFLISYSGGSRGQFAEAQPDFSDLNGRATNNQLVTPYITINGKSCILGSNCTVGSLSGVLTTSLTPLFTTTVDSSNPSLPTINFSLLPVLQGMVFAAPATLSGIPTFRTLVPTDIPTLNQNTTGMAAGLSQPLAVVSGGLNDTSQPVAGQLPIAQNTTSYAPVTITGDVQLTSTGVTTVVGINNVAVAASATIDTTNAGNITSGTLADVHLSNNVELLSVAQTITATKKFSSMSNNVTPVIISANQTMPSPHQLRITDTTNTKILNIGYNSALNYAAIQAINGESNAALYLNNNGGKVATQNNILDNGAGVLIVKTAQIVPNTYSTLPGCTPTTEGTVNPVIDSTSAAWGTVISGGGSAHVLAYCDGAAWTVMAK